MALDIKNSTLAPLPFLAVLREKSNGHILNVIESRDREQPIEQQGGCDFRVVEKRFGTKRGSFTDVVVSAGLWICNEKVLMWSILRSSILRSFGPSDQPVEASDKTAL